MFKLCFCFSVYHLEAISYSLFKFWASVSCQYKSNDNIFLRKVLQELNANLGKKCFASYKFLYTCKSVMLFGKCFTLEMVYTYIHDNGLFLNYPSVIFRWENFSMIYIFQVFSASQLFASVDFLRGIRQHGLVFFSLLFFSSLIFFFLPFFLFFLSVSLSLFLVSFGNYLWASDTVLDTTLVIQWWIGLTRFLSLWNLHISGENRLLKTMRIYFQLGDVSMNILM